jgi:hypothetical protein
MEFSIARENIEVKELPIYAETYNCRDAAKQSYKNNTLTCLPCLILKQ